MKDTVYVGTTDHGRKIHIGDPDHPGYTDCSGALITETLWEMGPGVSVYHQFGDYDAAGIPASRLCRRCFWERVCRDYAAYRHEQGVRRQEEAEKSGAGVDTTP